MRKAFTLMELLVVLCIIAILGAILMGSCRDATRRYHRMHPNHTVTVRY